ncbi:MAG: Gfo/Idh/MocA family oxidoreductase [Candidatus Latescibacteria bacterium]|nr:Gfo/Idh/MocA family oxidoreductase [Candidatus Latescibacterota bacterium]
MRGTIVRCVALVSVILALTGCGEDSVTAPETETKGGEDGLLRVGILTCGPSSHVADIWGPILNATEGRTRMTGMRMTQVWDIVPKDAESFSRRYGVEVVANFGDMVGKVDGVILSDFDAVPAYEKLARPYLEAGIPIFINRPFAYSLAEARSMIDLAVAHGTPIMSGSSFEYVKEVEIIRSRLAGLGPITGFVADNSMSEPLPWHPWAILRLRVSGGRCQSGVVPHAGLACPQRDNRARIRGKERGQTVLRVGPGDCGGGAERVDQGVRQGLC